MQSHTITVALNIIVEIIFCEQWKEKDANILIYKYGKKDFKLYHGGAHRLGDAYRGVSIQRTCSQRMWWT